MIRFVVSKDHSSFCVEKVLEEVGAGNRKQEQLPGWRAMESHAMRDVVGTLSGWQEM